MFKTNTLIKRICVSSKFYPKSFKFTDIVKKEERAEEIVRSSEKFLTDIASKRTKFTADELEIIRKTGAELFLKTETMNQVKQSGILFEDINEGIVGLDSKAEAGLKLTYLRNMRLLDDYDTLFRDFIQACARRDERSIKISSEGRLFNYISSNLHNIKNQGYNIEIESLKIKQNYKVLSIELFKNLRVERALNPSYYNYDFSTSSTPLGKMLVAKERGVDHSIFENKKPIILATTMLIKTPMKLAIFNQNLTKKLHGEEENKEIEYVVRFESEMTYGDLFWILPTQNKPRRLRQTKITDFNNVLRGNPLFIGQYDLHPENNRHNYMSNSQADDERVTRILERLEATVLNQSV